MSGSHCFSPVSLWQSFYDHSSLTLLCQVILEAPAHKQSVAGQAYLLLFVATWLLEAPVYGILLRNTIDGPSKLLQLTFILNLATHPLVTWGMPFVFNLLGGSNRLYLLTSELLAPLVEALLLHFVFNLNWTPSLWIAAITNLFSWWTGVYLFG